MTPIKNWQPLQNNPAMVMLNNTEAYGEMYLNKTNSI